MNAPTASLHPRDVLFDGEPAPSALPVCDHYAGVEERMRKSLELQRDWGQPGGAALFDVTLDCEDGAAAGGEAEHAALVASLLDSELNAFDRVGVRLPPLDHPAFDGVLRALLPAVAPRVAFLMLPKLRAATDVDTAAAHIDALAAGRRIPLHGLIETHAGLGAVEAIAAHARVESLSFGLMDFVSAHRGAIPRSAMTGTGQFEHPLVVRAKLEISAACHRHGKTPSHCVVTEFKDHRLLERCAVKAAREYGYTRMWSIHPDQIRTIIEAFAPVAAEVDLAVEILLAARAAGWAPVAHRGQLHDRASYRYYWCVLERAWRTGQPLPNEAVDAFFQDPAE